MGGSDDLVDEAGSTDGGAGRPSDPPFPDCSDVCVVAAASGGQHRGGDRQPDDEEHGWR